MTTAPDFWNVEWIGLAGGRHRPTSGMVKYGVWDNLLQEYKLCEALALRNVSDGYLVTVRPRPSRSRAPEPAAFAMTELTATADAPEWEPMVGDLIEWRTAGYDEQGQVRHIFGSKLYWSHDHYVERHQASLVARPSWNPVPSNA